VEFLWQLADAEAALTALPSPAASSTWS